MKAIEKTNKLLKEEKERNRKYSKNEGPDYFATRHPEFISPNSHRKTNKR